MPRSSNMLFCCYHGGIYEGKKRANQRGFPFSTYQALNQEALQRLTWTWLSLQVRRGPSLFSLPRALTYCPTLTSPLLTVVWVPMGVLYPENVRHGNKRNVRCAGEGMSVYRILEATMVKTKLKWAQRLLVVSISVTAARNRYQYFWFITCPNVPFLQNTVGQVKSFW